MPVINNGSQNDRIRKLQARTIYAAYLTDKAAVDDKVLVQSSLNPQTSSDFTKMKEAALFFTAEELDYIIENNRTIYSKIVLALIVSSFAGNGYAGNLDGTGIQASFYQSQGMATDSLGNIYVADTANNLIRKITPLAVVTTYGGNGVANYVEGPALSACFNSPQGIVVDSTGNVYVADTGNNVIRKITPGGEVSTIAGSGTAAFANGSGISAGFNGPMGMTIDSSGNLYVVDTVNNRIRKIDTSVSPALVSTVAGLATSGSADGSQFIAKFNAPQGITIDSTGSLYVTDTGNNRIRKITMTSSATVISTLAGSTAGSEDGSGTSAKFNRPRGITIDSAGNIFVTDTNNYEIRKLTKEGVVTTYVGITTNSVPSDGSSETAGFSSPGAIAVDVSGNLYVVDNGNNTIKKLITYVVPNIPLRGPSSPTGLMAYPGNAFVNLVWSPPALSELSGLAITGYSITAIPALPSQPIFVSDVFARITGLINGTLYIFSVSAVNSLGSSSTTVTNTPLTTLSATIPNPPTAVSAVRDNNAAIVSWTAPTNNGGSPITRYKVTLVSGGLTAFSTVVASTATSAPALGLLNGTTYTVSVFAINNYGASTAGTTTVTPQAVTNAPFITSSTYADRSAILNWIPNTPSGVSAPTGFTVFYKVTSSGSESSVSYGLSLRTATIAGLTNNIQYTFRIIATNPVGQSPSSQLVIITPNPTAPSFITVGTLTPKDQSAVVRWTAPYNGGAAITSYTITAIDSNNNMLVFIIPAIPGSPTAAETALLSASQGSAVSWKVNGLTNGMSYRFTVLAVNGYPNANGQATATPISTTSIIPLRVVPDLVTNVATIAGNYQITVSWLALDLNTWTVPGTPGSAGEEVNKYSLAVCDSTGAALITITPNPIEFTDPSYINASTGTTLSHTITGLTNVNYIFKVSSFNSIGESAATSSAPVMALVEPANPTNLSTSPNILETSITLAWTPPPNGITGIPSIIKYLVNVYDTNSITLISVYDPTPSITNTPWEIPNLTTNYQYYFSIIARNSVGDSPESDKVTGTPILLVPTPPTFNANAITARTSSSFTVNWSGALGASYYTYTLNGSTVIPSSVASRSARFNGLSSSTNYILVVTASNTAGSTASSPLSVSTLAIPPPSPITLNLNSINTSGYATFSISGGDGATSLLIYIQQNSPTFINYGAAGISSGSYSTYFNVGAPYQYSISAYVIGNNSSGSTTSNTLNFYTAT
jgi:sugar lactone lactonase YvrE